MRIVVPIMPRNLEEVEAIDVGRLSEADLIEWRADYLPKEEILTVAPAIFEKCNGKEVIFTVRTTREGGHLDLADQEYVDLIKEVAAIYQPDYIDFEYYSYQSVFDQMLEFPNLVLSYHNFDETPANYLEIMSELTSLSPAVVKMAVLANSEQDVLDVMNYTRGFKTLNAEQTFATIAMGELGKITRIAGVITGSCWTFASLDEVSAPGQMSLANTRKFLEILEN
ncbi:TPA: type I 3-dehydroquinate dehydratase [Streptococcus suis]|uniref:type I 3-dehydroquinate dehydratase n=1 Tax=Streptococcus suis TaxID=1307 RepID=UPI000CF6C309|nr:type I 3-dehydroquinate dehydratase [Streptococcus suis]NRG97796.1 type I 3-dehydroquinate dehydratase [Streptococcus suis]HEM5996859.1 type I 3-dehydroquinate dehydratase [Streptococcus suis]HEM6190767.1 type I 3-dehydroquinate dehydratase [Streptococcus suis]HEM6302420.1 type I 3-dehydroquinate dehydratase [Streptococcus suis]HEM6339945.1 type I 3-dehydroquinate dehydratase [Streptococcus suis]